MLEVAEERARQIAIAHGGDTDKFDQTNRQNDWVAYICAYVGRASSRCHINMRDDFRSNMVKVAALAVAAIEAYDSGWLDDKD